MKMSARLSQRNFISYQCCSDVIMSCHFAVLILQVFRDVAPSMEIPLGLTGTDCCEAYFSENGSFVMNRHVYSFHDMLINMPKMTMLSAIASRGLVRVSKSHTKQEAIWDSGTDTVICGKDIPDNATLYQYWRERFEQAQGVWCELGMDTSSSLFSHPESEDMSASTVYDEEVSAQTPPVQLNDDDADELDSHLRQVMNTDDIHAESCLSEPGHSLQIAVPDVGMMFKSTVVTLLNSKDMLSKDRLTRVKAASNATALPVDNVSETEVSPFSDVVLKRRSTVDLGRVKRIILTKPRSCEYTKPVSLDDPDASDLSVILKLYQLSEANEREYFYNGHLIETKFSNIVSLIDLEYDSSGNVYRIDEAAHSSLTALKTRPYRARITPTLTPALQPEVLQCQNTDRVVTEVLPVPGARSQRIRRAVTILDC